MDVLSENWHYTWPKIIWCSVQVKMFKGTSLQVHGQGGGATIVATVDVRKLSAELWILWGAPQSGGGTGRGEVPLLKFEKPCNFLGLLAFQ